MTPWFRVKRIFRLATTRDRSGTAADSVSALVATASGAALGGPGAAIVAAAAQPYLSVAVRRALASIADKRANNVAGLLSACSTALDLSVDECVAFAEAQPETEQALVLAVTAAAATSHQQHVDALGRALSAALRDGAARVTQETQCIKALSELDPIDVSVLDLLARVSVTKEAVDEGWQLGGTADVVLAKLRRLALAEDDELWRLREATSRSVRRIGRAEIGRGGTRKVELPDWCTEGESEWWATTFGEECLAHLLPEEHGIGGQARLPASGDVIERAKRLFGSVEDGSLLESGDGQSLAVFVRYGRVLFRGRYYDDPYDAARASGCVVHPPPLDWWTPRRGFWDDDEH